MAEPNSPREAVEQHRAAQGQGAPQKAEPIFKVGDIVVLRSGGPKMTIYQLMRENLIGTVWFSGDTVLRDSFDEAELEHAPPKETP